MKNDIKKNILIDSDEKIYKEFPKLKGLGHFCQVTLTTKRLIIFTEGFRVTKYRKVKKRGLNQIELKSINSMEYYLEFIKHSFFTRLIGFVFSIGAIILAYGIYANLVTAPTYIYSGYINYGALGILLLIGLIMIFGVKKILFFKVTSGFNNLTELRLKPNKYNELALKYLASKFF